MENIPTISHFHKELNVPFWYKGNSASFPGSTHNCRSATDSGLGWRAFPAITIKFVAAHSPAAHPAPPWNILLGKPAGHEGLFRRSASVKPAFPFGQLLFRRHQQPYFDRRNGYELLVKSIPRETCFPYNVGPPSHSRS